jgi:hypothetical protein
MVAAKARAARLLRDFGLTAASRGRVRANPQERGHPNDQFFDPK